MTSGSSIHTDSIPGRLQRQSPAINTQNAARLSINSFFDHIHNTSVNRGVATTD
jgi:hypothetical protein